jgi:CRP-like cAMP-binding protein
MQVECWLPDRPVRFAAVSASGGGGEPAGEVALAHVTDLEKGSCVGELEFLNQHPAVADCIARTAVRACKLHRDHFELCMGPVTDVLRRTVRQEKYAYYQDQLQDIFAASTEAPGPSTAGGAAASGSPSPSKSRRRQRHAVSAEADGGDTDDAAFVPPVVPKSPEALEQADAAVRRCPLFSAVSGEDAKVVVDALQPVHFDAGVRIIQEGTVPEEAYWYIVSAGAVVLKQRVDDDDDTAGGEAVATERELALLAPGQSFGELDLMYSTPSVVSAVALGDAGGTDCFRLDRRTYRKIVMQVTVERRRLYRELLTGVPFLAQLTEPQQLSLADALSPCGFTSGELLCRHGFVNEWMYIIVDGVVEVFGADGNKVCDLRRGEMVGELEFFNKHKTLANCVAKTHVTTCRLHRDHFEGCMGPVSGFIDGLLKTDKYAYYKQADKQAVA